MEIFRQAAFVFGCLMLPVAVAADAPPVTVPAGVLQQYVSHVDPAYSWSERTTGVYNGDPWAELILTSQQWHGTTWKHQLYLLLPKDAETPAKYAVLVVSGGSWQDAYAAPPAPGEPPPADLATAAALAEQLRLPVVELNQVPEEPLFGGLTEDALVAYSFRQYFDTGDSTWPLLLPMTASAARAMDAVQAYGKQHWQADIQGFLVTGGSKRGWTSWLIGAVDPRVKAIAPISFPMLGLPRDLAHEKAEWGEYSPQLSDFAAGDLLDKLQTPAANGLLDIVDPLNYRDSLTEPKLLVQGTNDLYWPMDTPTLFWRRLRGEKHLLYLPNNGHNPTDFTRLFGTLAALAYEMAHGTSPPLFDWWVHRDGKNLSMWIFSTAPPQAVRLWYANSTSDDFRDSQWVSQPVSGEGWIFHAELPIPAALHLSVYAEAQYGSSAPFFLSTLPAEITP